MESQQDFHRYWIFQGMSERYDLADKLVPGESKSWLLKHFNDQVKTGDIIYFWRGGRQAGLYGWGPVTSEPYHEPAMKTEEPAWRVHVNYQIRFSKPILKDEIHSGSHSAKLAGLTILRTPRGTNFKVTTLEAISLNQLIRDRSEEAPENPLRTGSPHVPALSLDPLTLGKTVTRLVKSGIRLAKKTTKEPLGGISLFSLLLALPFSAEAPPRGTVLFLRKTFPSKELPDEVLMAKDYLSLVPDLTMTEHVISFETLEIIESARLLAIYSTRREEIGVRHLLGAMLLVGQDRSLVYADEICRSSGGSLQEFAEKFIEHTVSNFPKDDRSLWMSQFRSGFRERLDALTKRRKKKEAQGKIDQTMAKEEVQREDEGPEPRPPDFVEPDRPSAEAADRAMAIAFSGRPVPDRPFGADLLQIKSEVAAMAHLFALREDNGSHGKKSDRATFALGLFGRWGAGKSFFIEKLKEKIDKLSKLCTSGTSEYCSEIIQIDFNAWHYNEANIWASLVHHIFDTLQKHFKALEQEKEFKNLIRQLEISQERREQLTKRIDAKEEERNILDEFITEKESEIDKSINEQMEKINILPARIAMNQAAQEKLLKLLPEAADILGLPTEELKENLEKGKQNAIGLLTILQESGVICSRGQAISKTILRSGLSRSFMKWASVVLIIYFGIPAWMEKPKLWDDFLTGVGQVIALASPLLIWLRDRLLKASNVFNQLAVIDAMLREDLRVEEEQKNSALVTLRAEQKRLSNEIADAIEKREMLDKEILDFKSKLDDLGSAESLIDYINDRATSKDYRSKLGILALIRRDFEKLSKLMTGTNKTGVVKTDPAGSEDQLPNIDRIILYIDDLDRVQNSKKVLQVLEAVHLLLALPLFHVVVAIDERWATRSVLSHHSDFFEVKGVTEDSAGDRAAEERSRLRGLTGTQQATPREFLEKIFQISFWVRPLSQQLTQDLIEGVVIQKNLSAFDEASDTSSDTQVDEDNEIAILPKRTIVEDQENIDISEPDTEAGDALEDEDTTPGEAVEEDKESESGEEETCQSIDEQDSDGSHQINFEITGKELVSIRALAPVIDRSPRTVKRFINTYRLFKAMDIPEGNGARSEEEYDENRIVEHHVPIMILLAIQVGHPDIAVRFFDYIDKALSRDDSQLLGQLITEMKKATPERDAEQNKWLYALNSLESVSDLYGDIPLLINLSISALNPWLLATSRFGFQEWVFRTDLSA